jgi:exosortase
VLLAAVALVFSPAVLAMSEVWAVVDYQAHGYLVAPVAAAMAWARRPALARAGRRPAASGLLVLGVALAAYVVGVLADLISLQGVALPAALAGLAAWRRGWAAAGVLAFPIAYLVFMVPVPPQWLAPLVTALQGFVTGVAIALLHAFEVPALREGNVLIVPEGSLFVAEACSGITSIVTLLPVAALLVFLVHASRRAALGLMLAVIPVAMFWNLVRVLATVAATRSVGVVKATTGSLHDTAGMLTFVMGCLTLLALSALVGPDPGERPPAG